MLLKGKLSSLSLSLEAFAIPANDIHNFLFEPAVKILLHLFLHNSLYCKDQSLNRHITFRAALSPAFEHLNTPNFRCSNVRDISTKAVIMCDSSCSGLVFWCFSFLCFLLLFPLLPPLAHQLIDDLLISYLCLLLFCVCVSLEELEWVSGGDGEEKVKRGEYKFPQWERKKERKNLMSVEERRVWVGHEEAVRHHPPHLRVVGVEHPDGLLIRPSCHLVGSVVQGRLVHPVDAHGIGAGIGPDLRTYAYLYILI